MNVSADILSETAHAKINLALHVRARRPDGYHEIETLFAFCEDGDRLTVEPADELSLDISGSFAEGLEADERNLVLRAAQALRDGAGVAEGAMFRLEKRLPVAAGLGGGSADAAAAIRLLIRLWGINPALVDLPALMIALGADVPACLASKTLFGSGTGGLLEPVDLDVAGAPVLLVNPRLPCATGPVFGGWDGTDRGPLDPESWQEARNDLELPAKALVPEIGTVLDALGGLADARLARMSGSGATCFALFDDPAACEAGEAAIRAARPHWWTMASRLR